MKKYFYEKLTAKPKLNEALGIYLAEHDYWDEKLNSYMPHNTRTLKVWKRNTEIFKEYLSSEKTMFEMAEKYKISKERISQIIKKILKKILYFQRIS